MQPEPALYVVATPIGNLGDFTDRAREVLAAVDLIAAEDTRVSRNLLNHMNISTRLESLHEHNEAARVPRMIEKIRGGCSVALISDAGTPLISDPGFELVRAAREAGVRVIPVPGVSALTAALSVCGLPCQRFTFEGFLPAKSGARGKVLESLGSEPRTMVFYESPRRVMAALEAMQHAFGGSRVAVVARELTKKFETIYSGTIAQLLQELESAPEQQRGEFVLIVAGADRQAMQQGPESVDRLLRLLLPEMSASRAAHVVARFAGRNKREVYQIAQKIAES